jgi:hypothetical protein
MTSGEGWHNNHRAHPTSARHGLVWYAFDMSWIQILILKFFGLAKSVQGSEDQQRASRAGRGVVNRSARSLIRSYSSLRVSGWK